MAMLLRIRTAHVLAYVIALVLIVLWAYSADDSLEDAFKTGDQLSDNLSAWLAMKTNANRNYIDVIMSEKMHLERSLVFFPIMLAAFIILLKVFNASMMNAGRVLAVIILAHLVIFACWLELPDGTKAWYATNANWLASALRVSGWSWLRLPLIRVMQLHHLMVTVEVIAALTFLGWMTTRTFRLVRWANMPQRGH